MINWPKILDANSIEYVDSGPSTAKNNIYVHCPMCGEADQGYHMGVSTRGRGWGCWRNSNHRGKSPVKLLAALLNVSYDQATTLLGNQGVVVTSDDDVSAKLKLMLKSNREEVQVQKLLFPKDIKRLVRKPAVGMPIMFKKYLAQRGYIRLDANSAAKQYGLRYALTGLFKYRLVFPVYTAQGLTTWTGRSIVPDREPRYLTLTADPEVAGDGPCAKTTIKDCLFNERLLSNTTGSALIVCEGPFDAMRIDYSGRPYGVYSTALFGKAISPAQIEKLAIIGENYKHKLFLLDPDAEMDRFAMWDKLSALGFRIAKIDSEWEDPGAMTEEAVQDFIKKEKLNW